MPSDESNSVYDRAFEAGQVAARLSGHDKHFDSINGSLGRLANEMSELKLQMQRIADAATARELTLVTTAQALKESAITQRQVSAAKWAPWQKVLAVLTVVAAFASLIAYIVLTKR